MNAAGHYDRAEQFLKAAPDPQSRRKQGGYNIVNTVSRHAVGHAPVH